MPSYVNVEANLRQNTRRSKLQRMGISSTRMESMSPFPAIVERRAEVFEFGFKESNCFVAIKDGFDTINFDAAVTIPDNPHDLVLYHQNASIVVMQRRIFCRPVLDIHFFEMLAPIGRRFEIGEWTFHDESLVSGFSCSGERRDLNCCERIHTCCIRRGNPYPLLHHYGDCRQRMAGLNLSDHDGVICLWRSYEMGYGLP